MKYDVKADYFSPYCKIDRSINSTVFFFQSRSPNIPYALRNKLIILENHISSKIPFLSMKNVAEKKMMNV